MIKDRNTLDNVFKIVKQVKKPLVKIYPMGQIIGTDGQFASLNILILEEFNVNIDIPYIFNSTELSSFMREISKYDELLKYSQYDITMEIKDRIKNVETISLINHIELGINFDELFNKVMSIQYKKVLYKEENIQSLVPDMFYMKVNDGSKMFCIDKRFLMTSFNAIHPANKTDRVDLIIRDYDEYSYVAEFIIYKKKDKYQLHEFLRFRKI